MSAAAAMAAEGGHAGHVSHGQADATNFVEINISSGDVTVPDGSGVYVISVTPILSTGITSIAANGKFYVTDATKRPTLLGGFVLDLYHPGGETIDITITKNLGLKAATTYAWIQDKGTDTYSRYTIDNNVIKNVVLDTHFSEANVILGQEVSGGSGGGSSSGCNAAAAPFMLFLGALPLLYFRKK